MSRIRSIVYKPMRSPKSDDHYVRQSLETATLITDHGIEGDAKGKHFRRQLNIMSAEMVEQLGQEGYKTAPGELGEQIVIEGLEIESLKKGERLLIGESAIIEIGALREPCDRFEHIQGKSAAAVEGRVGVLAKVISGGVIRVGDTVKVLETA